MEACLLWADVDSGLERRLEELASRIETVRRECVEHVRELHGDELTSGAM